MNKLDTETRFWMGATAWFRAERRGVYVARGSKVRAHDRRRAVDLGTKVCEARGSGLVARTSIPMYRDHGAALVSLVSR